MSRHTATASGNIRSTVQLSVSCTSQGGWCRCPGSQERLAWETVVIAGGVRPVGGVGGHRVLGVPRPSNERPCRCAARAGFISKAGASRQPFSDRRKPRFRRWSSRLAATTSNIRRRNRAHAEAPPDTGSPGWRAWQPPCRSEPNARLVTGKVLIWCETPIPMRLERQAGDPQQAAGDRARLPARLVRAYELPACSERQSWPSCGSRSEALNRASNWRRDA